MMLTHLVLAAVAGALPLQGNRTDTTFAVPPGTRLSLSNMAGEIVIRAWDRPQVRVQASHSSRETVDIELSGSVLRLVPRSTRDGFPGFGRMVDYQLTVPATMPVEIEGMYADVLIEGTRGPVKVNTVEGDLTVRGGDGDVSLTTLNGRIEAHGGRGRLELRSTSDDVEVSGAQGELLVEALSGDITLRGIAARRVDARSVSGDVTFEGTIANDAAITLVTHSGDITMAVPEGANASIRAAVAAGDIEATFPLPPGERMTRRRQVFRFGTGGATIELETFSGDIRLVRPGELRRPDKED